jgi:ABC-type Fe3+ transport system permease subunit
VRNPWIRSLLHLARRTLSVVAVIAFSAACFAQNCALCYTQAASSGARMIQGLRSGILVLVIPPMFMSVGITLLAYRKRNQFSRTEAPPENRTNGW